MVGNAATVTARSVSGAESPITTAGLLQGRKPISSLRTEKPTGIARPSRGLHAAK